MRARATMPGIAVAMGALLLSVVAFYSAPPAGAQVQTRLWSGVFSADQVAKGKQGFEENCQRCHGPQLLGSDRGPALKGDKFWANWENETLNTLFTKVRDNMPPNLTGNELQPQTKLDILSYILNVNEVPTGAAELKTDPEALDEIQILKKGAAATLPNFALVQVVGCLSKSGTNEWVLTNTSAPETTTQPMPPSGDTRAASKMLGDETFVLSSIRQFGPDAQVGHKVEARGLIYRAPGDNRIDLTSLQTVASNCGTE